MSETGYYLLHDRVVGHVLLTPEEVDAGKRRLAERGIATTGRDVVSEPHGGHGERSDAQSERLLTSDELGQATGTAASWWSNAAARGAVPCYRIGRWVRFRMSEVLQAGILVRGQRIIAREVVAPAVDLPPAKRSRSRKS